MHIEPDATLDWAANFAHMLGFDDYNMKSFSVIKIYKFNFLVMKFDFLKIMQIHSVFHVNLL